MRTYTIEDTKTGKTFEIEGPEDATDEELQQAADEYVNKKPEEYKLLDSLSSGIGLGVKGLKQTVGLETPESIAKYKAEIASENPANQFTQKIGEMVPGTLAGILATLPVSAAMGPAVKAGVPYLSKALAGLRPLLEGATSGGVSSGVLPSTEEGGQLEQAGTGAAIGAALPAVLGPLSQVGSFARGLLTKQGQTESAARYLIKTLGSDEALKTLGITKKYTPDPLLGTEHTVPAITKNLKLAAIQKGARNRFPAEFIGQEQANEALRRDFLRKLTPSESDINMMKITRDINSEPLRTSLTGTPDIEALVSELNARAGNELAGGTKRSIIEDTNRLLQGEDKLSPLNKLLEVRDELTRSLSGKPGTTFRSAPIEQKVAMDQLDLIDGEINRVTGGKFGEYLDTYSRFSEPLNEAEALTNIQNALSNKRTLTQDNLTSALRKFKDNAWGPNLSASKQQDLEYLAEDLAKQEFPSLVRAQGSDTEMNALLDSLSQLEGPLIGFRNPLLGVLRGSQSWGKSGTHRAFKDLIIDPKMYTEEISKALKAMEGKSSIKRALTRAKYDPLIQSISGEE